MSHLVVLHGNNRGVVHELEAPEVFLGRDAECGIQLLDDEASRRHARIVADGGGHRLEDLDSRNGTYINGVRYGRRELSHGDEIAIGGTMMLFVWNAEHSLETREVMNELGRSDLATETRFHLDTLEDALALSLIGDSQRMRDLAEIISLAAPTDATILVTGESGAGKELVARAVHRNSPRNRSPFVVLNCAALSEQLLESELFGHEKGSFTGAVARRLGRFEFSHQGTLFLDEIGEVGAAVQAKLLRVIETGEFQRLGGNETIRSEARIVTATNRDLAREVENGGFRRDLYYRLRVIEIKVPPLRERIEDLGALADHFLAQFTRQSGMPRKRLAPEIIDALTNHPWPGNVRELRNVLERMYFLGRSETLTLADLPQDIARTDDPASAKTSAKLTAADPATSAVAAEAAEDEIVPLKDMERRHVLAALNATGWNRKKASAMLGIDRKTLYAKLKSYGIEGPD